MAGRKLRTPLIVLAPAAAHGDDRTRWVGAIRAAGRQPLLWLGVRHSKGAVLSTVKPFTSAIADVLSADSTPPSVPSRFAVSARTPSSISVDWAASIDPSGPVTYRLYRDGERIDTTVHTSYTLSGLPCGTALALAVDAVDAVGNYSGKATISTQTLACEGGGSGGSGGGGGGSGGGGPSGSANLYVSTGGNDATCVRNDAAKPCATFGQAFKIAADRDTIEVEGGTYPGQTIPAISRSSAVEIRPSPGVTVALTGDLNVNSSHVHIHGIVSAGSGNSRSGLDICDADCGVVTQDILIDGYHGMSAFIRASGVTVTNSEFGSFDACAAGNPEDGFRLWGGSGATATPQNDTLDHVTVHDIGSGSGNTCQGTSHAGYHVDCMQTQGGVNITIRDSIFYNCPTSDIQAEPFSGATESNWLIENNFFGDTACCNSIVLTQSSSGGACSSLVVRYNVLTQPVNDFNCGSSELQSYGNIFTDNISSCPAHTAEAYDIYPAGNSATCRGTGNKKCNPAFVNGKGAPPDYHLTAADTCARGAGDPSRYPSTDFDGQSRPQGTVDAGPDEVP